MVGRFQQCLRMARMAWFASRLARRQGHRRWRLVKGASVDGGRLEFYEFWFHTRFERLPGIEGG